MSKTLSFPAGGGTPGGSNNQIQFNNGGVFGGDDCLYFANDTLNTCNLSVFSELGAELAPAITAGNYTVGTGWAAVSGGILNKNAAGTGTATPTASTGIVIGGFYKVVVTVGTFSGAGANLQATIGGQYLYSQSLGNTSLNNSGTYTCYITASTTDNLIFIPNTTCRCTITSTSVKQITGGEINGNSTLRVTAPNNAGENYAGTGERTEMLFYPKKAAFRAGKLDFAAVTAWDDANIGYDSVAIGYNTEASGASSLALGGQNQCAASFSDCIGTSNSCINGSGRDTNNSAIGGYNNIQSQSTGQVDSNIIAGISSSIFSSGANEVTGNVIAGNNCAIYDGVNDLIIGVFSNILDNSDQSTLIGTNSFIDASSGVILIGNFVSVIGIDNVLGMGISSGGSNQVPLIWCTDNDGTNAGMVGIGVTDPTTITEKLQINGNIKATGYKSSDGSAGITATITTAKLTLTGANGSQTFKNGLLVAQTPAT